jgi:hypothetical protein
MVLLILDEFDDEIINFLEAGMCKLWVPDLLS